MGLELFLGKKLKTMLAESPSHTVGFKPYKLVKGLVETLLRESPSHTVGSELAIDRRRKAGRESRSPSHTVGSELLPYLLFN